MTKNIKREIYLGIINMQMADPTGNFLTAVQKISGCKDGRFMVHQLGGPVVVGKFRQDGAIPPEWKTFLMGFKEGFETIRRFEEAFLTYQRNNEAILQQAKVCTGVGSKTKLIPKDQTPLVLALVRIYARNGIKIAEAIDARKEDVDVFCAGRKHLPKALLRTIIDNLEIPEEPFKKWL